jgi:methyl-accepting chemotaxis protein
MQRGAHLQQGPHPMGSSDSTLGTQPTATNRRRTRVVNAPMQRRIVLAVTLFPAIGLTATCVVVAWCSRRLLSEAMAAEAELPSLVPLLVALLAFVAVSGLIVGLQAFRFSHRIAGPAYRLTHSLDRIRQGDIGFRVRLRDGDELVEIADALNRVLDWLASDPPRGVKDAEDLVQLGGDRRAQVTFDSETHCVPRASRPQ